MVKGVSRQVIVVHAPEPKLFEQAIFILKEDAIGAEGVTDDALLREAKRLISASSVRKKPKKRFYAAAWAAIGAALTATAWLLSIWI